MLNLSDIIKDFRNIQSAVNSLHITPDTNAGNARIIVYVNDKCEETINALVAAANEAMNEHRENSEEKEEAGE